VTLAVSHGSRSQLIAAKLMGIRSVLMLDYEYTESRIFNRFASCLLIPEYIPDERLLSAGFNLKKIIRYKGFKEELYLSSFIPDPLFREKINVPDSSILIVFRPPGMTSNYHDNRSEQLLISALKYFSSFNNTLCLIINRGDTEKKYILSKIRPKHNIRFQQKAVDGLQLLYTADIAVSGGGTMNRESALLGTRTYSIFTGRRPYLDEYLQHLGKLNFIESDRDIEKIAVKKHLNKEKLGYNGNLVGDVVHFILDINRVN
jgi:predicted glycosyltransferase